MRSATMRAVRCHRFAALDPKTSKPMKPLAGSNGAVPSASSLPVAEVLSLEEDVPAPTIGDGRGDDERSQVLISARYAGIQYPDFLQAQGLYQIKPQLPYIPGMDVVGVVLDKGQDVPDHEIRVGDRVYANTALDETRGGGGIGALAQVVRVSSNAVFPLPDGLHMSAAANLGRNYCAAYHSLKVIGQLGPADLLLVDGASGGVGLASVELAKAMGASVVAAVSHQDKAALPRAAGADEVLVYGSDRQAHKRFKADFKKAATAMGHPEGASLIVDVVHGHLFQEALLSCIRPLGKICLVGFAAGQKPIKPGLVLIKEATVVGSLWGRWARANPLQFRNNMNEILTFMVQGKIQPRADNIFSLEDYVEAFQLFENNAAKGNTVICIQKEDADESVGHYSKL